MLKLEIAKQNDAPILLKIQYDAFYKYTKLYGDFDSNPIHMDLHRMEFNINYQYGKYYKILDQDKIVGGIFIFELDDSSIYQIDQFYLEESYQNKGFGKILFADLIKNNPFVSTWYVDTILEEKNNVSFYESLGFEIIDYDKERDNLIFVTLIKK